MDCYFLMRYVLFNLGNGINYYLVVCILLYFISPPSLFFDLFSYYPYTVFILSFVDYMLVVFCKKQ